MVIVIAVVAVVVVVSLPLERPHFVHFCILSTDNHQSDSNPNPTSIQTKFNPIERNVSASTAE